MASSVNDDKKADSVFAAADQAISIVPLDTSDVEDTHPDGGFRAWATVLGSFFVLMCSFGNTASFGVYQDFYVRTYMKNETPSAISWIGGLNAFLVVSGGIISGKLYDRGHFYAIMWGGSLLMVVSMFLLSFAQPNKYYQVFLTQAIGTGIGGGLTYAPSVAVISQYFNRRRSLAMSFATIGISVGSVVHPLLLNNLLSNPRMGFSNSVRADAGLQAGLLLLACLLLRSNAVIISEKAQRSTKEQLKKMCADKPFVATMVGFTLFSFGWYFFPFYIQLYATTYGISEAITHYALVIMNATGVVGGIFAGLLANKLGVGNIMTVTVASCAALDFAVLGLRNATGLILICIIYGFFSAISYALPGPLVSILTEDVSELGMRIGIVFFCCGIGGLIGPPVTGALLTSSLIWWRGILFNSVVILLGSVSFGMMLWFRARKEKVEQDGISARTGTVIGTEGASKV